MNTKEMESKKENLSSNKLRDMPVGKLLFVMALPAIISMFVQALYNFIDSAFVGMYYANSPDYDAAVQALSLAFPMQLLITAAGLFIGVGANACISRKLGEKDREGASRLACTSLVMAVVMSIVMLLVGLFASRPFIGMMAAETINGSSGVAIEMGTEYLVIVSAMSFGVIFEITVNRIFQATGNMKIPMITQGLGAITNIVLDPIFIFVFKMGVVGAAWATVIAQILSAVVTLTALIVKKHDVRIRPKYFAPNAELFGKIAYVGLPAFVSNAVGSVTYISLIMIIKGYAYGGEAQTVLGFYFKVCSLVTMPVFGLMQGMLPILGYNYGSGDKKRFTHTVKLSIMFACMFFGVGLVLFEAVPNILLSAFSVASGSKIMEMGTFAFRIIAISFVFAGVGITIINVFQALQSSVFALLASMLRQLGFIIPFALIFGQFNVAFIWMAYPVAELLSSSIFFPIMLHTVKRKFPDKIPTGVTNGQVQTV